MKFQFIYLSIYCEVTKIRPEMSDLNLLVISLTMSKIVSACNSSGEAKLWPRIQILLK